MTMDRDTYARLVEENRLLREKLAAKDREIRLVRSRNLFLGELFNGISEEIMVIDPEYTVIDANKTFLERYGVRREDILGRRKCYEIKEGSITPCQISDKPCPIQRAMETGERVEMTHRHRQASGEVKEFILILYPIKSALNGEDYFVEIVRDGTESRNMIRKLQASEKRLKTLLDTATNAVISIDENHNIILFNNAAERMFQYKREEVLGKDLNMLIPPQYGDHYQFVRHFLDKRQSDLIGKTVNLTALRKDGKEFPIELSLSYMEMQEGLTFTAIIRDVSEKKLMEKKLLQSERLAAVGEAVAHVVHELKNPLMIIGGFTEQIKRSLNTDTDMNKANMILDEVARLERLVAGLGDFTKTYRLVKRRGDINLVLKDVIKIMGELYPVEKYGFREFFSSDVGEILCDPDKLRQAFINIIANGFEAMPDGGYISIATGKKPGGVEVKITDEGIGIPDDRLAHIFEPFYTTRQRGSGLGLSISYKIVQAHNGEISALSEPGRGTTFIVRLPDRE